MGLILARKRHQSEINENALFELVFIMRLHVPLLNNRTTTFLQPRYYWPAINGQNIFIVGIHHALVNLLVFRLLFLWLLKFISTFVVVHLWQPRPGWIDAPSTISILGILLPFYPRLNQYYYGDGFSQKVSTSIPFWLASDGAFMASRRYHKPSDNDHFFYTYSIEDCPTIGINHRLLPAFVLSEMHGFLTSAGISIEEVCQQIYPLLSAPDADLLIFPTTTFCETRRSTLDDELCLYRDFLANCMLSEHTIILLKPHPSSSLQKYTKLAMLSLELNKRSGLTPDLSCLQLLSIYPLELFLMGIIRHIGIDPARIRLVVSSTAGLSVRTLFPCLQCIPAFGATLIHRYINPSFTASRLDQELRIANYLS
jgi:hypothetical protein